MGDMAGIAMRLSFGARRGSMSMEKLRLRISTRTLKFSYRPESCQEMKWSKQDLQNTPTPVNLAEERTLCENLALSE